MNRRDYLKYMGFATSAAITFAQTNKPPMTLPQETIDKIRQAAAFKYTFSSEEGERIGYQAGATEWAGKAQGLVLTLELINTWIDECMGHGKLLDADRAVNIIDTALAKYKEVSNG